MFVKLQYYRETGKWYAEARHDTIATEFHDAVDEVKEMLDKGKRPGLVDGFVFHTVGIFHTKYGKVRHLFLRVNKDR